MSPVCPTSSAFSYIPALFAGKFTNCLALEYPFVDHPRVLTPKGRKADLERFHAATGALLGFGQSAPSVASPILASLRTLVVDSRVLTHHLEHPPPSAYLPVVSPAPSELVLHTYIPWSAPSPSISPLAPLGSRLTHLTVASPSAKWTLSSTTLAALGGVPSLTHLALVRKAHANEDNDAEFVQDVSNVLSERRDSLLGLVLVVIPDSGFTSWKYTHGENVIGQLESSDSSDDEEDHNISLPSSDLRLPEVYLGTTYIWTQFTALTRSSQGPPFICVIPGMPGDAWARALRKSRKAGAVSESNIFHDHGRDLWTWARKLEVRRRRRERAVFS